jgi:uncharacterized membrane protein YhaH (DUF805 family)
MGMMDAVQLFFKRYTDFQGRSRRAEYWWVYLFNLIIILVLYMIMIFIGGMAQGEMNILGILCMIIILLYSLAVLIPGLAIAFRRMHDRDMSAWWLLLGLIPYLGGIILLVMFALPGTAGPNKFGPDPKGGLGPTAAATFE